MSPAHHFTLYTTKGLPPNGWKVMIVLEELGLDYHPIFLDFSKGEHKAEAHTQYNPNGRIPTLIDHKNGDLVVWESDAILTYLVDKYDPAHKLSFARADDKIHQLQWLFFQSSGQGPYFGQAGWFLFFASEKLPGAIERYQKEVIRVLGVLEKALTAAPASTHTHTHIHAHAHAHEGPYLVGGKVSVADLSFIMWNEIAVNNLVKDFEGFDFAKDFPTTHKWHKALTSRPAVEKVLDMWRATL